MGMTCGLVQASDADIVRLRTNAAEVLEFIQGDEWAPPVRQVRPKGVLGWLLRLTPITIEEVDPDAVPPEGAAEGPRKPQVDLDKAWQPLHYLLTGTAWEGDEPGCYLVRGGVELGDEDAGYSSVRGLTAGEMRAFHDFLSTLSHDTLRQRFDRSRMIALKIYSKPRKGDTSPADGEIEPLLAAFDDLHAFVAGAATDGEGAIVYLT